MIATPAVTVFDVSNSYTLTSRVIGAVCRTTLQPGEFGRATASVDLLNNDGALTPNGGGTYSTLDWFATGLRIQATTSQGTANCFDGVITSFELVDDGKNSYVRLGAVDGFSLAGSTQCQISYSGAGVEAIATTWIRLFYVGNSWLTTTVALPRLNAASSTATASDKSLTVVAMQLGTWTASGRSADFLSNTIMPAGPNFAWPTTIESSGLLTNYKFTGTSLYPLRNNLPSTGVALKYVFSQNPTTNQLPIQNLERGFNSDDLLNTSNVTSVPQMDTSTVTASSTNSASVSKFGTRASSFTTLMTSKPGVLSAVPEGSTQSIADRWANTYSSTNFVTQRLTVSDSAMRGLNLTNSGSVTAYRDLLDCEASLLQLSQITFTPTGAASSTTEYCITMGREIQFTLDDVRINVDFMIATRSAFVLNSSVLGVLDSNRLG